MNPDMRTVTYAQHLLDLRLSRYAARVQPLRLADPLAFRQRELRGMEVIKKLQTLWSEASARQDAPPRHSPTAALGASSPNSPEST